MKKLLSFLLNILLLLLYPLGFFVPRSKKNVVLAAGNNAFAGNPKHLYFYFINYEKDINATWLTKNTEVYKRLKDKGLPVAMYHSWAGVLACLRAQFWFYNMSLSELNFYASAGATKINLWHGTPIKLIGNDARILSPQSPKTAVSKPVKNGIIKKIIARIESPYNYVSPDYFVSSSTFTTQKIFKTAFGLPDECYLEYAYPRSDIFFQKKEVIKAFVEKYETSASQSFIKSLASFEKVFFYLPTYRDSDRNFIEQASINLHELNEKMRQLKAVFIFKMHPRTDIDLEAIATFSNLLVMDKEADIYTVMPYTDCLITDYSSVYFDYLLLEKEIVLFPFDMKEYQKDSRGLYFDFEEVMLGKMAFSFEELLLTFEGIYTETYPELKAQQKELRHKFWDDYKGNSGQKIANFIKSF